MALLQALLTLIARSSGKIVSALFGWAVAALFGPTSTKETPYLSAVVAAAALWPFLVLGTILPRLATFALAFIPVSRSVPAGWLRAGWIALAVLVPIVVGVVFSRRAAGNGPPMSRLARFALGFPITLAVAGAFLFVLFAVPVRKLVAVSRRLEDEHVPLIVDLASYHEVARVIEGALRGHGFAIERHEPTWVMKAPTAILQTIGGATFRASLPDRLEYWRGPRLEIVLQPNGVSIRGLRKATARAHGLIDEVLARSPALQSLDPASQAIEKQIKDVWKVYDARPSAHAHSQILLSRLVDIAREIANLTAPYADWQVVYRQAVQLSRALHGKRQLLEGTAPKEDPMPEDLPLPTRSPSTASDRALEDVPLRSLVATIMDRSKLLIEKEAQLAIAELRKDLQSELAMAKGLAIAALALLLALDMLLLAAVFGLARVMPAWAAALVVAGPFFVFGAVLGVIAWSRRVQSPLATTRQSFRESLQWAKNRLA